MTALEGIEVKIPELRKTAITDSNGSYGFGFGESADQTIPSGRHLAVINPDLVNSKFGSVQLWINVEAGGFNEMGVNMIPILNPEEPFRRIKSHQSKPALLAGEELTLELVNTQLTFPNGRSDGDVHVQFMQLNQLGYICFPSAIPHWAFAVHPINIAVSNDITITYKIPELYGTMDYIEKIGERVLLVGLDDNALQIVPVGVGKVDRINIQVVSEKIELNRLDYLGYAMVPSDAQVILDKYVKGEIVLREMIGEIERLR